MKTWDQYKDNVKDISSEEKKDMEQVEAVAAIVSAIVQQRNDLGLTQRELAVRCGIPQSSIARIESFKTTPNLNTLLKIMNSLGLQLSVSVSESSKATA